MSVHPDIETGDMTATQFAEVVAVARDFAARELAPRALEIDLLDAGAQAAAWTGICEIGLDRGMLPESAGGVGLSLEGLLAALEELAVGEAGVAMLTLLSNAALVTLPDNLVAESEAAGRSALVLLAADGTPGARLLELGDANAHGSVPFALGAFGAERLTVVAARGEQSFTASIACAADGLKILRDEDQLGLRGAPAARLEFEHVSLRLSDRPDAALIGETLLYAGCAAIARGVARRALTLAREYAENRYQGGSMIIEYGAIREMLARIAEQNRVTAVPGVLAGYHAGGNSSRGGRATLLQAIAAKTAASDAAVTATIDAVQSFGGMGYMHETGAEKVMRDAKYCQLFPQANWLARDALLATEGGR